MSKNNDRSSSKLTTITQRLTRFEEIGINTIKAFVLGERQAAHALDVLHATISKQNLNSRELKSLKKLLDKEKIVQRVEQLLKGKEGDKSSLIVAKLIQFCPDIITNKIIQQIFKLLAKQVLLRDFSLCENWMKFLNVLSRNFWGIYVLQCMEKFGQLNNCCILSEELLKQNPSQMIQICANISKVSSEMGVIFDGNCFLWMEKIQKLLKKDAKNFEALTLLKWFLKNLGSNFWQQNPQSFSEFFIVLFPQINLFDGFDETKILQFNCLKFLLKSYQNYFIQFPAYLRQKNNISDKFIIFDMFIQYSQIKEIKKCVLEDNINSYYEIFINILKCIYVFQMSEGFQGRINSLKNQIEQILDISEIFLRSNKLYNEFFNAILYYLLRISSMQNSVIQSKIQNTVQKYQTCKSLSPFVSIQINNNNNFKKSLKINWYKQICETLHRLFFSQNFYSVSHENVENFLFLLQPKNCQDFENNESLVQQLSDKFQEIHLSYFRSQNEEIFTVEKFELFSAILFLHSSLFNKLLGFGFSLEKSKNFINNNISFQINNDNNQKDKNSKNQSITRDTILQDDQNSNYFLNLQEKQTFLFGNSSLLSLRSQALQRQLTEAAENNVQNIKIKSGNPPDGIKSMFDFIQFGCAEFSDQTSLMHAQNSMGFTNSFSKIPLPQEFIHFFLLNPNVIPVQGWLLPNRYTFDIHPLTTVDKYNKNLNACIQTVDMHAYTSLDKQIDTCSKQNGGDNICKKQYLHELLQFPKDQFKVLEWRSEWGSPLEKNQIGFDQNVILFAGCYGEHAVVVPVDAEYAQHVCPYIQGLVSFHDYAEQSCNLRIFQPGFVDVQTMFTYLLYLYTRRVYLGLDISEIEPHQEKQQQKQQIFKQSNADKLSTNSQIQSNLLQKLNANNLAPNSQEFLTESQTSQQDQGHFQHSQQIHQQIQHDVLYTEKFSQKQQNTISLQQNESQYEKIQSQSNSQWEKGSQDQVVYSQSSSIQEESFLTLKQMSHQEVQNSMLNLEYQQQSILQQETCCAPNKVRFCVQDSSISCCGQIRQLLKLVHAAQLMLDEELLLNLNTTLSEAKLGSYSLICIICMIQDALTLDLMDIQGLLIDHLGERIYHDSSLVNDMQDCLPHEIWEIVKDKVIKCRRNECS